MLDELVVQEKVRSVSSGLDLAKPAMPPPPPEYEPEEASEAPVRRGFSQAPVGHYAPPPPAYQLPVQPVYAAPAPYLPPQPTLPAYIPPPMQPPPSHPPSDNRRSDDRRGSKRSRWNDRAPSPDKEREGERSGRKSPSDRPSDRVMTEYLPKAMDAEVEKQLREQKKMQQLEARIREAARAQLQPGRRGHDFFFIYRSCKDAG